MSLLYQPSSTTRYQHPIVFLPTSFWCGCPTISGKLGYACDIRVICLLRDHTLGNSSARLLKQLKENHGEEWLNRLGHYFEECANFVNQPSLLPVVCQEPPEPIDVPTDCWLLSVYGRDILSRIDHIKASITSTFGIILKLDSTKKITKKLAGNSKGTALWVSSVSNELGEILNSVLTVQEGPGLDRMAAGLMDRYHQDGVAPPKVLYVDCGCCVSERMSKLQDRFGQWPDLHIRLDMWHFMRRLAVGCTTDAHPLYPAFMRALSSCIFEWDAGDLDLLRQAKIKQLQQEGIACTTSFVVEGTSANALNFQLYLLEGLNRWNQDRAIAAVTSKPSSLLTYAGDMTQCINNNSLKVSSIVALWQNLLDYDKQRVIFAARHLNRLNTGRFRSPKKRQEFTPGVESVKRHALTTTAPSAQWPDCCRLVETIFVLLCVLHRSPKKRGTGTVSRWDLILQDYRKIRQHILNGAVMQQTNLQLVDVSYTTLVQWHNKRVKKQETAVVLQGFLAIFL
ncbi:hypothetical protein XENOCAPTIV_029084 [Xenoophorus captivus]|uniref:DUF6729 domain-containing protein n=1 Tax=Xenoophorus captivus TaxID=1517983 RepID=A0ABV0Q7L1_9TELE